MAEWFESWFDSPFYHILYDNRDQVEAQKFINNLIQAGNYSKDIRILDLACGKGRHSVYLNSLGFQVTGMDLSQSSIKEAACVSNERLSFVQHDMRNPLPDSKFDLVLNLFTSFGYFDNPEENSTVLKNIHKTLCQSGTLIIDFFNAQLVVQKLTPTEVISKHNITFNIERKIINGFIEKKISFVADERSHNFCERVQLFSLQDFEKMLSSTGFELKRVAGDYNLGKFVASESDRLILIAEKKSLK